MKWKVFHPQLPLNHILHTMSLLPGCFCIFFKGQGKDVQIFDSMIDLRHKRQYNYAGFECRFLISKQVSSFQQHEFHWPIKRRKNLVIHPFSDILTKQFHSLIISLYWYTGLYLLIHESNPYQFELAKKERTKEVPKRCSVPPKIQYYPLQMWPGSPRQASFSLYAWLPSEPL